MKKPEVYVSIDIEADGPIPGIYSMLSLGAAAFQVGSRQPIATFSANLKPLAGAQQDPDTMAWWELQPEAWAEVQKDPLDPAEAMQAFLAWINQLPGKPVAVCYPTWDFMWIYWYLIRFTGEKPFGLGCLDIKTAAMMMLAGPFRDTVKKNMPRAWFYGTPPHTHKALDDAIGQGVLWINIITERLKALQDAKQIQQGEGD